MWRSSTLCPLACFSLLVALLLACLAPSGAPGLVHVEGAYRGDPQEGPIFVRQPQGLAQGFAVIETGRRIAHGMTGRVVQLLWLNIWSIALRPHCEPINNVFKLSGPPLRRENDTVAPGDRIEQQISVVSGRDNYVTKLDNPLQLTQPQCWIAEFYLAAFSAGW
jgi:hypothetical protein